MIRRRRQRRSKPSEDENTRTVGLLRLVAKMAMTTLHRVRTSLATSI